VTTLIAISTRQQSANPQELDPLAGGPTGQPVRRRRYLRCACLPPTVRLGAWSRGRRGHIADHYPGSARPFHKTCSRLPRISAGAAPLFGSSASAAVTSTRRHRWDRCCSPSRSRWRRWNAKLDTNVSSTRSVSAVLPEEISVAAPADYRQADPKRYAARREWRADGEGRDLSMSPATFCRPVSKAAPARSANSDRMWDADRSSYFPLIPESVANCGRLLSQCVRSPTSRRRPYLAGVSVR
jgi:hypothetical protein